ncbi:hypothetical protein ACRALDRAFT_207523 [Sodiomyces alcalophilus JCM 7366]|uniref:uncharacterized protein n=1 Tax=Sodiomyces alcalophilus JCM 7366 TaxID=591952 RepID=UPI0039B42294
MSPTRKCLWINAIASEMDGSTMHQKAAPSGRCRAAFFLEYVPVCHPRLAWGPCYAEPRDIRCTVLSILLEYVVEVGYSLVRDAHAMHIRLTDQTDSQQPQFLDDLVISTSTAAVRTQPMAYRRFSIHSKRYFLKTCPSTCCVFGFWRLVARKRSIIIFPPPKSQSILHNFTLSFDHHFYPQVAAGLFTNVILCCRWMLGDKQVAGPSTQRQRLLRPCRDSERTRLSAYAVILPTQGTPWLSSQHLSKDCYEVGSIATTARESPRRPMDSFLDADAYPAFNTTAHGTHLPQENPTPLMVLTGANVTLGRKILANTWVFDRSGDHSLWILAEEIADLLPLKTLTPFWALITALIDEKKISSAFIKEKSKHANEKTGAAVYHYGNRPTRLMIDLPPTSQRMDRTSPTIIVKARRHPDQPQPHYLLSSIERQLFQRRRMHSVNRFYWLSKDQDKLTSRVGCFPSFPVVPAKSIFPLPYNRLDAPPSPPLLFSFLSPKSQASKGCGENFARVTELALIHEGCNGGVHVDWPGKKGVVVLTPCASLAQVPRPRVLDCWISMGNYSRVLAPAEARGMVWAIGNRAVTGGGCLRARHLELRYNVHTYGGNAAVGEPFCRQMKGDVLRMSTSYPAFSGLQKQGQALIKQTKTEADRAASGDWQTRKNPSHSPGYVIVVCKAAERENKRNKSNGDSAAERIHTKDPSMHTYEYILPYLPLRASPILSHRRLQTSGEPLSSSKIDTIALINIHREAKTYNVIIDMDRPTLWLNANLEWDWNRSFSIPALRQGRNVIHHGHMHAVLHVSLFVIFPFFLPISVFVSFPPALNPRWSTDGFNDWSLKDRQPTIHTPQVFRSKGGGKAAILVIVLHTYNVLSLTANTRTAFADEFVLVKLRTLAAAHVPVVHFPPTGPGPGNVSCSYRVANRLGPHLADTVAWENPTAFETKHPRTSGAASPAVSAFSEITHTASSEAGPASLGSAVSTIFDLNASVGRGGEQNPCYLPHFFHISPLRLATTRRHMETPFLASKGEKVMEVTEGTDGNKKQPASWQAPPYKTDERHRT